MNAVSFALLNRKICLKLLHFVCGFLRNHTVSRLVSNKAHTHSPASLIQTQSVNVRNPQAQGDVQKDCLNMKLGWHRLHLELFCHSDKQH